jgi:2-aminoadipate transaminase
VLLAPIPPTRGVDVAARVAALSRAAPYAVPAPGVDAGLLRLVSGAPAPEALPVAALRRSADRVLGDPALASAALGYGASHGLPALRSWIAQREGVPDAAQVLVTNGALHGVSLAFEALLEPGDVVVLDDPVFPDTVRIAEQFGATVVPVPVGVDGIDVTTIAELCTAGVPIKVVYTVADFHNPSGGVLPAADRAGLTELAERFGFVVVSDNPYRDTGFDGTYVDDFDAAAANVVRVGTFTKTLGAGLRLGWIAAPTWLTPHLENLRRRTDFHSGGLAQAVILPLLEEPGWFDGLLADNRRIHGEKARVFSEALTAELGDRLVFTRPGGGFFVWARLADDGGGADADALVAAAATHGLLLTAGRHFAADGGPQWDRHLRFAFSSPAVGALPEAARRLAAALHSLD